MSNTQGVGGASCAWGRSLQRGRWGAVHTRLRRVSRDGHAPRPRARAARPVGAPPLLARAQREAAVHDRQPQRRRRRLGLGAPQPRAEARDDERGARADGHEQQHVAAQLRLLGRARAPGRVARSHPQKERGGVVFSRPSLASPAHLFAQVHAAQNVGDGHEPRREEVAAELEHRDERVLVDGGVRDLSARAARGVQRDKGGRARAESARDAGARAWSLSPRPRARPRWAGRGRRRSRGS